MESLSWQSLADYWSAPELATNILVFFNLLGALLLGLLVGYERSYHGRAAGMRTYGLVCMASAALTVIGGYPEHWFGGHVAADVAADPTRVIQGIVTGVGFLGAGVIMREGFTISGLTTAASIWSSAAIGVMVGVGFYGAAMLLALLSAMCMMWVSRIETWLPSRPAVAVMLRFAAQFQPSEAAVRQAMSDLGYEFAAGSIAIHLEAQHPEWHFVAVAVDKERCNTLSEMARFLSAMDGVEAFRLSHARN